MGTLILHNPRIPKAHVIFWRGIRPTAMPRNFRPFVGFHRGVRNNDLLHQIFQAANSSVVTTLTYCCRADLCNCDLPCWLTPDTKVLVGSLSAMPVSLG